MSEKSAEERRAEKKADLADRKKHPENYFDSPHGHIRDRIIIHESEKLPKNGMFIQLNGYGFLAKAGVEIDIPRPVRLMLDTRIETQTFKGEDDKSYTRNIPRITYTLVKEGVNVPPPAPAPETAGASAE